MKEAVVFVAHVFSTIAMVGAGIYLLLHGERGWGAFLIIAGVFF